MKNNLIIQPEEIVLFRNKKYKITRLIDLHWVIGEEVNTGKIDRLRINDLVPISVSEVDLKFKSIRDLPLDAIPEEAYIKAQKRFSIIKPLLDNPRNGQLLNEISSESGKSAATLYRWIELYNQSGKISSLVPLPKGGKGQGRISEEVEQIIKCAIEDSYLTKQRKTIQKTCIDVIGKCKQAGLEAPHINTIRNRISQISEYDKAKGRLGKREADLRFGEKTGRFPGADYPLSIVQIDHTKLDIIVVDDVHRKPIGRPWITLGIDVYSRIVTGFYISMDPPGTIGTGLCISNSILAKDDFLIKHEVKGEWPCWGIMDTIHLDNAREFRGNSLFRSCSQYGINISWRPVARPEYGGHIERLLGTFAREIHALPGSTFSNIKQRKDYDSVGKAVFTLDELEKWLTTFIVEVYHKRIHSSIKVSPLQKYNEGIFGNNGNEGVGIPPRISDSIKLKQDFLPTEERTIQDYGVLIEHIHYYHDVLRRWINSTDPGSGKSRLKRKFIFKRDPRDISIIYFLDPELKEYFPIPYRDISRPSLSIWEFNEVLNELNKHKKGNIQEDDIFEAYERLRKIESDAVEKSKATKKTNMKALRRETSRASRGKEKLNIEHRIDYSTIELDEEKPEAFENLDF